MSRSYMGVLVAAVTAVSCGSETSNSDKEDLNVVLHAVNHEEQRIVVGGEQQALALASFPEVVADGEWTHSPSVLLSAKTAEINDGQTAFSLTRDANLLRVRTQNGDEYDFQIYWDGTKLTVVDVFEADIGDAEAAGFLLWRFLNTVVASPQEGEASDVRRAITGCFYICYEFWIGTGSFACKYYPRGIYYGWDLVFLDLPRAAGAGRITFYCNELWYWSSSPGWGT